MSTKNNSSKFEHIYNNMVNGNIADYQLALLKLRKDSLLEYIVFVNEITNRDNTEAIMHDLSKAKDRFGK